MANYAFFVPGNPDKSSLAATFDLAGIERGKPLSWIETPAGPIDGPGLLGVWLDLDASAGPSAYQPTKQTWQKCPGRELWVGWETARPPGPQDLAREEGHQGLFVTLADGNEWLIPVAKWLPHFLGLDELRRQTMRPKPAFERYCQHAEKLLQQFENWDRETRLSIVADWEFVVEALALNYRVNEDLVSVLGLIDQNCGARAMAATIELELINDVELQKKTESAGTGDG